MGIKSYSKLYVENVAQNLGTMFQYAVNLGIEPIKYWEIFINSSVAKQIENGNPRYLAGMSAIELLIEVLNQEIDIKLILDRDKYYWAGYVLAYYQNYKGFSFYRLNIHLPIEKVLYLYNTLHEADISKFYLIVDEYIANNKRETNLKRLRKAINLTQEELAIKANVSLRNIQMYEQRQNNINKAQVDILLKITKALGCRLEDVLEDN